MDQETKLIKQIISKLGQEDNSKLIEKTIENLRLLQLKSNKILSTTGDYAKIVLCIDIASVSLGVSFDFESGLKLSGLRRTQYINNKKVFEKFLDINKLVGINEICLQLGLNGLSEKANKFLTHYKNSMEEVIDGVDFDHPQYAAMSVYQACKSSKRKCPKTMLIKFSNLKSVQWVKLENQWNKILSTYNSTKSAKSKDDLQTSPEKNSSSITNGKKQISASSRNVNDSDEEAYETWKNRMLKLANARSLYATANPRQC